MIASSVGMARGPGLGFFCRFLSLIAPDHHHGDHGCESACCAAPKPIQTVVDPPAEVIVTPGGRDEDMGARSNADGGIGFPLQSTVWDAFADQADCMNPTSEFITQLDETPRLRSAASLRSLSRIREALEAMPEQSALDEPVCISLQDALVVMSQLMARLR